MEDRVQGCLWRLIILIGNDPPDLLYPTEDHLFAQILFIHYSLLTPSFGLKQVSFTFIGKKKSLNILIKCLV